MNLSNLPAAIFSPAKVAYISFVILSGLRVICPSLCTFIWLTLAFLVIEIGHNDYLRIVLNRCAEKSAKKVGTKDESIVILASSSKTHETSQQK
jgi:hypothetical protein